MRIPFSTLILASFFSLASAEAPFAAGSLGVPLTDPPPGATPPPGADRPYGAVVGADAEGTSGLRPDDLIVAYNGAHVESSRALKRMVAETPAGREVEIRVIRGGTPRLLRLRLPSAPPPPTPVPGSTPEREPSAPNPRQLGARVVPLDPDIARKIELTAG
jgi:S1-C subfamily serine protease